MATSTNALPQASTQQYPTPAQLTTVHSPQPFDLTDAHPSGDIRGPEADQWTPQEIHVNPTWKDRIVADLKTKAAAAAAAAAGSVSRAATSAIDSIPARPLKYLAAGVVVAGVVVIAVTPGLREAAIALLSGAGSGTAAATAAGATVVISGSLDRSSQNNNL